VSVDVGHSMRVQHVPIALAEKPGIPDLLKGLQKGDRVSLEIGPDDQVNKIVKAESGGSQKPTANEPSE
jgi:hypothetical protein